MATRSAPACALAALALMVSACTVGPNYTRPVIETPAVYRGTGDVTAPDAQSLADQQWSEIFQDDALRDLIRRALTQGYDIRAAAARVLEAQAQLGVTRADQYPTVSGQANVIGQRGTSSSTVTSRTAAGTQLLAASSWQLDFWGRYRRATEAARAELLASEWGRRAVMTTIVSEVAQGDLDENVQAVVAHLLAGGPEAVRAAKQLVRDRPGGPEAAEIAAARRTSAEGQDGLRAFLKKRTPAWRSESSS